MKTVLFHRAFERFSGGHLKVWHYFEHVRSSITHTPFIRFSAETQWGDANPWQNSQAFVTEGFEPDVFFVAGMDWIHFAASKFRCTSRPVINLIQHVRHAMPGDPRFAFLRERAVRICVSPEVRDALLATGIVNGPLRVIPNAIDRDEIPPSSRRLHVVFIGALKQPVLGAQLAERLRRRCSFEIDLLTSPVSRQEFLKRVRQSMIAVVLPNPVEGFFLPALEAMACESLVVCPDCIGNRSFCLDGQNCLRPEHTLNAIYAAIERVLEFDPNTANEMRARASQTVQEHDILTERMAFIRLLNEIEDIW